MEYTSRVQRRQQLEQEKADSQVGVEELIDLEITKEMPITVQINVEQTEVTTRQANRQQKQINQLVEGINPLEAEEPVADTNLEILKKITVVTPPQTLADDVEYEAAATKFSEATQQLSALIGDLQKNKRKKPPVVKKADQQPQDEKPRHMFDLELAQTQEMPILSQLHSQTATQQEDTQQLQTQLQTQEMPKIAAAVEAVVATAASESKEIDETPDEDTKELSFNYKNPSELQTEQSDEQENDRELAKQIAKDRFINKILIATLIFLSVAVIITLGIGLSIIFLNQNGLN